MADDGAGANDNGASAAAGGDSRYTFRSAYPDFGVATGTPCAALLSRSGERDRDFGDDTSLLIFVAENGGRNVGSAPEPIARIATWPGTPPPDYGERWCAALENLRS